MFCLLFPNNNTFAVWQIIIIIIIIETQIMHVIKGGWKAEINSLLELINC